jgi:murein DD-endopeptidase MepM/ murein hydrolase activator NlpD
MTLDNHRLALVLAGLLATSAVTATPPDGGQVLTADEAADQVSDALDRRLVDEVSRNLASLKQRGITPAGSIQAVGSPRPPGSPQAVSGMTWPLGPVNGAGTAWHGISNFVDLNPAFPGQVTDYTCAARSYDTAAGYNHRGIDYFIWPFAWTLMDTGAVDVLAVAPGTLLAKGDGNNDRSCSFNAPDTPNYAVVLHADGSVARYLHMKNGSVTSLPIGAPIPAGTPLGKVGSSGISTGPHLHLELRASNTAGAAVIEPHTGACNVSTTMSFAQTRPYREPRINRLSTHSAAPQVPSCPSTTETPNFKNDFVPGDPIVFTAAYRDQGSGQATSYRVLRPDGSVFSNWNHAQNSGSTYNGSYWYWSNTLPANAPTGLWTFEATFEGLTSRHSFQVADGTPAAAAAFPVELSGSWYNTATSGQGFNLDMVGENRFLLYFYGYDNQGKQLWLYGDFNPGAAAFAYDVPVEIDMYVLEGGGFQVFTPPANRVWGTARLIFESCKRATIELTGESGTQILQLDKLNTTRGLSCP